MITLVWLLFFLLIPWALVAASAALEHYRNGHIR